jgi:heterodisulfide reductase subunit B
MADKEMSENPEKLEKINDFIEKKYTCNVKVQHFLEILRDSVGFEKVRKKVKRNLNIKVAPYYGCMLLRPTEIGLDNPEEPKIFEDLLQSLGCEVVDFPYKTECCGSYLIASSPKVAARCSAKILNSAMKNGADVVAVTCPLCHFNLDKKQKRQGAKISIMYFTQLLAIALDLNTCEFNFNVGKIPLKRKVRCEEKFS